LFELIKKGEVNFPSPYWDQISDMAKDLIKKILQVDPKKRLNAEQILANPWIVGEKTPRKPLMNVTDKIKEYNAKRRFKVYNLS
jgi:serine/threonine protein kinase